jgi:tetratricopeptide (TPR) repeat protein
MQNVLLKKVGQSLIMIMLALIPILFLPNTLVSLDPLKIFLITTLGFISLLIVIVQKIKQNSFYLTSNPLVLSLCAVVLTLILSTIFSNNIGISLFGRQITTSSLLGIISLIALAFSVYTFFDDVKSKTRIFAVIFISGVVAVLIHLFSIVFPFFPSMGFFVNGASNTVGGMMDLGIFSLLIVISSILVLQYISHSPLYKIFGWIGLISGMILLFILNSALLFVLAIIFTLSYVVIQVMSDRGELDTDDNKSKNISHSALAVFILSILFLLIGGKASVLLGSYFNAQLFDVRPSFDATFEVTKDVFVHESIMTKVLGVGINRFDIAWLKYRPESINISQFWDTDFVNGYSFITSVGVTQGILGLIAWLSVIIFGFYFIYRVISLIQKSERINFLHIYITLVFTFLLTILIVFNPSYVLFTLFFVFLGLFISILKDLDLIKFREFSIIQSPRISFAYILTLVLFMIFVVYGVYIQTTQYVSRVLFDNATIAFAQNNNVDEAIQKIINLKFISNSDVYDRALIDLGMSKLGQIVQNQNLTQEQALDMFGETLRSIVVIGQNALAYDSNSYVTHLALLEVYKNLVTFGVADAKEEAFNMINRIEVLVPNNPTVHLERARVHALNREYDSAIENIEKALILKPNYTAAAFLLSQIQVEQGKIDEAISTTKALILANRFDANSHFRLGMLYYNQNKYQDAIVSFENALLIVPSFQNARYFLGLSYYQNNRSSDAIIVFENLNILFPENQEIQKILVNMKSGLSALDGIAPTPESRPELPLEEEELEENDQAQDAEEDGQN